MNLKNSLNHISYKTIALFIITAFLLPSFSLIIMVAAEEETYQNITVDTANYMITHENKYPNLVILDVRTPCEFEKGHLYNAILMPHDELVDRIDELEEYKNSDIIVYCKSGVRSQQASEILMACEFTNVYIMLGGIIAWVDAEYPIYTTYHHATVDKVEEELLFKIEPLIKYSYVWGNDVCGSECQPNLDDMDAPNITLTVLEEVEDYTEILITLEFEDTIIEGTIAETLLFHYEEFSDKTNRTVDFIFTEITIEEIFIPFYKLNYLVQDVDYNLNLRTLLTPLNSESYNVSSTIMSYDPFDKSEVLSMEFVVLNFSTKLSEMYNILGKVAKKIGKVYEKSEDDALKQLANAYYIMEIEVKSLSELVNKQFPEYDYQILESYAGLKDAFVPNGGGGGDPPPPPPIGCFGGDPYWDCFWCEVAVGLVSIGLCAATIWWFPGAAAFCIVALDMFLATGSTTIVCMFFGCC